MGYWKSCLFIDTVIPTISARAEYEKFVLKLPWQIQAQYIGLLVAKDKGFYENGGAWSRDSSRHFY